MRLPRKIQSWTADISLQVGGAMNPIDVMLGLFLAVGGYILGCALTNYLYVVRDRKRIWREWEQQTKKEVDIT